MNGVRDMIRIYSQIHRTDKYSKHSSVIWPVWLNGWAFVYEPNGFGFESSCTQLIVILSQLWGYLVNLLYKTVVYKLSKLFRFYHFTSDLNADSPMMQFFSSLIKIVRISEKIRNNKLAKRKWMILMNKRYVLLMRLPLL